MKEVAAVLVKLRAKLYGSKITISFDDDVVQVTARMGDHMAGVAYDIEHIAMATVDDDQFIDNMAEIIKSKISMLKACDYIPNPRFNYTNVRNGMAVYLDGSIVGHICNTPKSGKYQYKPLGQKEGGELFNTLEEVKASIEGED